ncbi:hypothetical protein PQQ87_16145 [Paraburkholderia nemoris]|uniref:hypothetical protein n=1 Tax=Paraburkholderia nemoris TaxID=2793076 RepID=UPI0038BCD4F8
MTAPEERKELFSLINEATLAGAHQAHACNILGLSARTVQRWQRGEPDAVSQTAEVLLRVTVGWAGLLIL